MYLFFGRMTTTKLILIGLVLIGMMGFAVVQLNPASLANSAGQRVVLTMDHQMFDKTDINAQAGKPITVELVNQDTMNHQFEVPDLGVKSSVVRPGQRVSVTFTPDKPGDYQFICPMVGHKATGMWGTLHVAP